MKTKVPLYAPMEYKHALDDSVRSYLSKFTKENRSLPFTSLALGYIACIVGIATACWNYYIGFHETKLLMWFGVVVYYAATGALWYHKNYVEKEIIFSGKGYVAESYKLDGKFYRLRVNGKEIRESVGKYFTYSGYLDEEVFINRLEKLVKK